MSVTPQDLSEHWCIGLGQATENLKRTTQRIVRLEVIPLDRRYQALKMYENPRLRGEWFTYTLDGLQYTRYISTARGSSLAVNDCTLGV